MALHRCLVLRMSSLGLLLCCLGAMVSADPVVFFDLEDAETYFQGFIETYNKQYSSEEEKSMRFEIFKESLKRVNEKNLKSVRPVFGITRFSDLTADERKAFIGHKSSPRNTVCYLSSAILGDAPDEFDWRKHNIVTPVKDQGPCASGWAFSAVGNIESQSALFRKYLLACSEGQILDCDKDDSGCSGGRIDTAFRYVQEAGGLMSKEDYPYKPQVGECKYDEEKAVALIFRCYQYQCETEHELRETLFQVGPLSVAVDGESFFDYDKGILKDCEANSLNHAVLLVGYGTEDGVDYWLMKNSWGTSFGEDGYIRVERNLNACNIMSPEGFIGSSYVV